MSRGRAKRPLCKKFTMQSAERQRAQTTKRVDKGILLPMTRPTAIYLRIWAFRP